MKLKEKATLSGRSLLLNALFVFVNLAGLVLLVMGYHPAFEESAGLFKTIAAILMITSVGGIFLFKGKLMMASVARVFVGGLFIVSGLVKANDPLGFSYKLEEYFEDGALAYRIKEWFGAPGFSMEFLMDWALALSIIICIAEIVLGVLTIIGGKIKLVSYLMLLMMLFFTFLTWHTATCDATKKFADHDTYAMTDPVAQMKIDEAKTNKDIKIISKTKSELVVKEMKLPQCVDDCGCFGDAMKGSVGRSLTPAESLWKDIVLLYLVTWIFLAQWTIKPNSRKENIVYLIASGAVIVFFSWIFTWYFPILFGIASVILALFIRYTGGKYLGNYWGSALIVTLLCLSMESYVLKYEPLKDYRPYALGSDLRKKMTDGIDGQFEYYYFLTDLKSKKKKRVKMSEITPEMWSNTERWKADYDTIECIVEPKNPSIMDFNPILPIGELTDYERSHPLIKSVLDTAQAMMLKILDLGYQSEMEIPVEEYSPEGFPAAEYQILDTMYTLDPNMTEIAIKDALLDQEKVVILISRRLSEADRSSMKLIRSIAEECEKNNVPFILLCNAGRDEINAFRKKYKLEVPAFLMDEIELKVISRSNPAMLVLEKGVVAGKYPNASIPTKAEFVKAHLRK
jgi:uncharacterized membrane protein YphA (DoxX/SURF4 family)